METVYLETSFVSYLTARPSRSILGAAHQQVTRDWWERRRSSFALRVSELVVRECSAGDPEAVSARLASIVGIPRLALDPPTAALAKDLVRQRLVPPAAAEDALHIVLAASHGIDFILTWNFKHIANPMLQLRLASYLDERGMVLPFICTPEELLGEDSGAPDG